MNPGIKIEEADRVEVTTLIDNYTDSLLPMSEPRSELIKRAPRIIEGRFPTLLAEHGLSLLLKLFKGTESHSLLMDTGRTSEGLLHNLETLKIDISEVEAVVLSHGHMDHFGSLIEILKILGHTLLIVHPDAFLPRYIELPDGTRAKMPLLDETAIQGTGARIIKTKSPFSLASDLAASLGEVERITDFEKAAPYLFVEREGEIEPDLFPDDQGVVVNLNGKGLVVLTGCAHAGLINTIRHAQKITEVEPIYAVLGGFHLTGPRFKEVTERTIEELKRIDPAVIVPMHCTCWAAMSRIAEEMPDRFKLNSVGTTFIFE